MPKKTNFENPSGKKYFRATAVIGHKPDGSPIRKQFYGESKKEAEQKRDDYKAAVKGGMKPGFDRETFGGAYLLWYDAVHKPTLAEGSKVRYKTDNKRILSGSLAPMKLAEIKAMDIQNFYQEMLDGGVSVGCVANAGKLLKPFFKHCIAADLLIKDPMLAVKAPREKKIEEEMALLDKSNVKKIIADAKRNKGNALIFVFLALTGLREGEALALRHRDVDLEAGVVKVNKNVGYLTIDGKYQAVVGDVKAGASRREVPIVEELKPLLAKHVASEKEKHLRLGIPFDGEIFFSSTAGTYIQAKNLRISFERLLDRLNIKQVTVHSLRHYFCSQLAENGVNLKTASVLMGHSNINITAKIYAHVQREEKQRGIATLSSLFADVV
jgi:integrase